MKQNYVVRDQIGPHDVILAAMALHTGCAVATFNVRHFAAVKGLKVIQPK
jgi:predicted nucleic acid-binding protein